MIRPIHELMQAAEAAGVIFDDINDGLFIEPPEGDEVAIALDREVYHRHDEALAYRRGQPLEDPPEPLPAEYQLCLNLAFDEARTDLANAERFIDRYHSELLYVPPWKSWLSWDGSRWVQDGDVGALQRAERYSKSLWDSLRDIAKSADRRTLDKIVTFLKATSQASKIHAFMELAAVDERVVCNVRELNSDPSLLNCPNGTVDLTTGVLRPHNPADRITQVAGVVFDANAERPRWLETLNFIFDGNAELIRYCQQLLGYSLSGETGEHILPIAYGSGCNGKSTIWNVVAELLGDYATLANEDLLLGDKSNHPTEKASLYQKRFVAISEPERDANLRESRVKELTGDRTITARRMHEDFWTFTRTHTFWIS